MGLDIPYHGESLALITAIVWAVAVILFKKCGETVHPIALNLFKNSLAVILFIPTVYIFSDGLFLSAPLSDYLLLLASGALGIGLADTLYFKSLNLLGASLIAIVSCLYSTSIITLSFIFLGERMAWLQLAGALMIISAVLTVGSRKGSAHLSKGKLLRGISWGALAMLANGIGVVMIKPLLDKAPILWVVEIRLFGGLLALLPVLFIRRDWPTIIKSLKIGNWKYTLSGSFLGTYLAMIFWLAGLKYTQVSTAAALNQTATIFIFILATVFLKEPVNRIRIAGILLAIIGSFFVTFG